MILPAEEYMKPVVTLREHMKEQGIDAFLCFDELNQRYLSGFAFTDGFLLITAESAYLVTDFRYLEHAEKEAYADFKVLIPDDRTAFLKDVFGKEDVHTVAMEGKSVPFATLCTYEEKYPDIAFVDIGDAVERIRQLKTPEELALMQKAQDITDLAFSKIVEVLTPDMTEMDVAAELEYIMRKNGATGFAFDTISVSGDASALPHGTPRNVKLRPGFLTMDFGAKYNGYCSDMTRTVVIGKADADIRRVYETVLHAQTAVLEALHEGVDCGEMDKIARDIIDKEYPGTFGHGLGHSVGLYIHESPAMNRRSFGRKLRAGEIVTVEPGIYLQGKYGCRIEDMVAVTPSGIMNFTHSRKDLIEIY